MILSSTPILLHAVTEDSDNAYRESVANQLNASRLGYVPRSDTRIRDLTDILQTDLNEFSLTSSKLKNPNFGMVYENEGYIRKDEALDINFFEGWLNWYDSQSNTSGVFLLLGTNKNGEFLALKRKETYLPEANDHEYIPRGEFKPEAVYIISSSAIQVVRESKVELVSRDYAGNIMPSLQSQNRFMVAINNPGVTTFQSREKKSRTCGVAFETEK